MWGSRGRKSTEIMEWGNRPARRMKNLNQSIQLGVYQLCMTSILFLGKAEQRSRLAWKVGELEWFDCVCALDCVCVDIGDHCRPCPSGGPMIVTLVIFLCQCSLLLTKINIPRVSTINLTVEKIAWKNPLIRLHNLTGSHTSIMWSKANDTSTHFPPLLTNPFEDKT